jgi:hypothetical protein
VLEHEIRISTPACPFRTEIEAKLKIGLASLRCFRFNELSSSERRLVLQFRAMILMLRAGRSYL